MDFLLCCVLSERIRTGREGRRDESVINMSDLLPRNGERKWKTDNEGKVKIRAGVKKQKEGAQEGEREWNKD